MAAKAILHHNYVTVTVCIDTGIAISAGKVVTFAEFAQYVADTARRGLDPHWTPQHKICHPCYIDYDFIGRFENLAADSGHVLARIAASGGPGSNTTFPIENAFDSSVHSSATVRPFFTNMSRSLVQRLINIYRLDYELFGYDYRWACHDC